MGKRIVLWALFVCGLFSEQGAHAWGVDWGITGGVGRSNYRSGDVHVRNRVGWHADLGLSFKMGLRNQFSIGPEFSWTHNRVELDHEPLTVNLFQLPVTFGYQPLPFLRLHAGPVFKLYDKTTSPRGTIFPSLHSSVGYVAGIQFRVSVVQLWLRYSGQFAPRDTYWPSADSRPFRIRYSSLSLGVGFAF